MNSKNKKTKIDQKNDIITIAESLLKEISLVFQPKIQNKAIQTKENSSIMLAIDTRNVPNPNDVDINHIVDQEIRIHLEVSELEEKYHNAAFNYYFKLYEWSRLKDQQILWLYNHPEPAKKLFNIDIDSKCSIEESSKKVKKYFLIQIWYNFNQTLKLQIFEKNWNSGNPKGKGDYPDEFKKYWTKRKVASLKGRQIKLFVDKYGLEFFKLPVQIMEPILKNNLKNLTKIIEFIDSKLSPAIKELFKPVPEIEAPTLSDVNQVEDVEVVAQETTNTNALVFCSSPLPEVNSDQISTDEEYESDSTSKVKEAELVEGMNING